MKQIQKFGWHLLPIIISQLTQETSPITFPPDTKENDTKTNTQYGRRWYKHDLCIQISVSDQLRSHLVAKVETNASGVTWCSLCYISVWACVVLQYGPALYCVGVGVGVDTALRLCHRHILPFPGRESLQHLLPLLLLLLLPATHLQYIIFIYSYILVFLYV